MTNSNELTGTPRPPVGKPRTPERNFYQRWNRAQNLEANRKRGREYAVKWRKTPVGIAFTNRDIGRVQAKNQQDRVWKRFANDKCKSRLVKIIAHHLSRGRDVGQIAIMERIPVSMINAAIQQLPAEKPATYDD